MRNFEVLLRDCVVAVVKYKGTEVSVTQFTIDFMLQPFPQLVNRPITHKDIDEFFEDRCFPESRFNCRQLLKDLEIDFYEPSLIVQKTHGVQFDDYFWLRFEGEGLCFNDIKVRD